MKKSNETAAGHETGDDVVLLGTASIATKGPGAGKEPVGDGEPPGIAGISEE